MLVGQGVAGEVAARLCGSKSSGGVLATSTSTTSLVHTSPSPPPEVPGRGVGAGGGRQGGGAPLPGARGGQEPP